MLLTLEARHAFTIQRPPLAYTDELARAAANDCGAGWYFSIADFDMALLEGTLQLKSTTSAERVTLDAAQPSAFRKSVQEAL